MGGLIRYGKVSWIFDRTKCIEGYDRNCEWYCMRYGTDRCYFKRLEDKEEGGEE